MSHQALDELNMTLTELACSIVQCVAAVAAELARRVLLALLFAVDALWLVVLMDATWHLCNAGQFERAFVAVVVMVVSMHAHNLIIASSVSNETRTFDVRVTPPSLLFGKTRRESRNGACCRAHSQIHEDMGIVEFHWL
jgi:hypothetical protein